MLVDESMLDVEESLAEEETVSDEVDIEEVDIEEVESVEEVESAEEVDKLSVESELSLEVKRFVTNVDGEMRAVPPDTDEDKSGPVLKRELKVELMDMLEFVMDENVVAVLDVVEDEGEPVPHQHQVHTRVSWMLT